jgi:hypothetical protein
MKREVERRIGYIHAIAGAIFGAITPFLIKRPLTFLSVIIIGIVVSYPLMSFTRKIFNLTEEEFQFKDWLAKGFFFFFTVWIVVWIFLYNLI